jgi:SOS-response transcriptional repressor LexA
MVALTHRMQEALTFIRVYGEANDGTSPSLREIKQALGLNAVSSVHRIVTSLVERGALKRQPYISRGIEEPTDLDIMSEHLQWLMGQMPLTTILEALFKGHEDELMKAAVELLAEVNE